MDDCIAKRGALRLAAYRTQDLHLDGILTVAYQLGFSDTDARHLIERLTEDEQGRTREERLAALLVRAYCDRHLGIDQLLVLSVELGFDDAQQLALIDVCGAVELSGSAA